MHSLTSVRKVLFLGVDKRLYPRRLYLRTREVSKILQILFVCL